MGTQSEKEHAIFHEVFVIRMDFAVPSIILTHDLDFVEWTLYVG